MSNRAWHEKRELLGAHGLPLNQQYFGKGRPGDVQIWNEKAIRDRSNWLVDVILQLWPDLSEVRATSGFYDPERHPRLGFDYRKSGVTELTLFKKRIDVYMNAWNIAAQIFTNEIAVSRPDFEALASDMDSQKIVRDGGYKQLDNGWWLRYMNPSEAADYLMELASLCELDDSDWSASVKFYG